MKSFDGDYIVWYCPQCNERRGEAEKAEDMVVNRGQVTCETCGHIPIFVCKKCGSMILETSGYIKEDLTSEIIRKRLGITCLT